MVQYELSPKIATLDLLYAVKNYSPEKIFIRLVGSSGGTVKVNESLSDKQLSIQKTRSNLAILINNITVFDYKQESDFSKKFAVMYMKSFIIGEYKNYTITEDDYRALPNAVVADTSIIRGVDSSNHLMEIYFPNKIPLKIHSPSNNKQWYHWEIDKKTTSKQ